MPRVGVSAPDCLFPWRGLPHHLGDPLRVVGLDRQAPRLASGLPHLLSEHEGIGVEDLPGPVSVPIGRTSSPVGRIKTRAFFPTDRCVAPAAAAAARSTARSRCPRPCRRPATARAEWSHSRRASSTWAAGTSRMNGLFAGPSGMARHASLAACVTSGDRGLRHAGSRRPRYPRRARSLPRESRRSRCGVPPASADKKKNGVPRHERCLAVPGDLITVQGCRDVPVEHQAERGGGGPHGGGPDGVRAAAAAPLGEGARRPDGHVQRQPGPWPPGSRPAC